MSSFLKRVFVKNFEAKVIAFLMAAVVWTYLNLSTTDTFSTTATIEIRDRHKFSGIFSMTTLRGEPVENRIRITVSGPKKDIRIIRQRDIICRITPDINPERRAIQEVVYQLRQSDFNLHEFEIIEIATDPEDEIRVKYTPFVERRVKLVYPPEPLAANLKRGLVLGEIDAPAYGTALVPLGEEETLNLLIKQFGGIPVKQALLAASDEGPASVSLEIDYDLVGKEPPLKFKGQHTITCIVTREPVEIVIKDVPVRIMRGAAAGVKNITLSTAACDVTVNVRDEEKGRLTRDDIICFCEITVPREAAADQPLTIMLPLRAMFMPGSRAQKASIVKISPETVEARIEPANE